MNKQNIIMDLLIKIKKIFLKIIDLFILYWG